MDSREAARRAAYVLLLGLLVGIVAGLATFLFLYVDHLGVEFLWTRMPELVSGVPPDALAVGVVITMTAVAALIAALWGGKPYDTGRAEAEFDGEGRMAYRNLPAGVAFSLASLFSGAVVGPEAPLTDMSGGIGSWIGERFRLPPEQVRLLTYAGVAGAFGAFFGAAPVGAILAAELINPKAMTIGRLELAAGLTSGAAGYVTYLVLGGQEISPLLSFPAYPAPRLVDLGVAAAVGLVGGAVGLVYGGVFVKTRVLLKPLRARPWPAALIGGLPIAVASVISPYLLFSGQSEVPQVIGDAATLGVLVLFGLGLGKLVLSTWSLSSIYFGGPIFPVIFAGTCFGLALNLLVPALPQGIAVLGIVAGMVVAATAAPFSITVFLALIAEPSLAPVIAIAAVAAFVLRQAVAPTLPGVYRASRAAEARAE